METTPYPVEQFGGLNVKADPTEVGATGATNLLNVTFDQLGALKTRDGSSAVTVAAANNQTMMSYYSSAGGTDWIVSSDTIGLKTNQVATGTAGPTSANGIGPGQTARFGDPSNTRLYIAGSTVRRFDGAAFANVAAAPSSATAAVTANSNRLVLGTAASRLNFSAAGDPETWPGYTLDLTPGDGEYITNIVRWRDRLFAFKLTKFFVFTGESTLSDGTPVFNYFTVDAGRGAHLPGLAVAGEEGCYFADATGVYVTTGGTPVYISGPIEPWLRAGSFGSLPSISLTTALYPVMVYHDRRLYVVAVNGASSVTLVYDPTLQAWSVWQIGAVAACSVPLSSANRGLYFGEFTSKKIAKIDSSVSTDLGSARNWSYTSGLYDMEQPGMHKWTRETEVWGSGTVTQKNVTVAGRPNYVDDPGMSVTLGTAPAIDYGLNTFSTEGVFFQHVLSGSGQAVVSRLVHRVDHVSER